MGIIQKLYRPQDLFWYFGRDERWYLKSRCQDVKHKLANELKFLTDEV